MTVLWQYFERVHFYSEQKFQGLKVQVFQKTHRWWTFKEAASCATFELFNFTCDPENRAEERQNERQFHLNQQLSHFCVLISRIASCNCCTRVFLRPSSKWLIEYFFESIFLHLSSKTSKNKIHWSTQACVWKISKHKLVNVLTYQLPSFNFYFQC